MASANDTRQYKTDPNAVPETPGEGLDIEAEEEAGGMLTKLLPELEDIQDQLLEMDGDLLREPESRDPSEADLDQLWALYDELPEDLKDAMVAELEGYTFAAAQDFAAALHDDGHVTDAALFAGWLYLTAKYCCGDYGESDDVSDEDMDEDDEV